MLELGDHVCAAAAARSVSPMRRRCRPARRAVEHDSSILVLDSEGDFFRFVGSNVTGVAGEVERPEESPKRSMRVSTMRSRVRPPPH
jgi:hypothetical protein